MADRKASITVSVEGAEEAAAKAEQVKSAWKSAGQTIGSGFAKAGEAVGKSIGGLVRDFTRLATVAEGFSFAKGIESARAYNEAISRVSSYSGKSVDNLKARFESLAKKNLVPETEIVNFTRSLSRMTYDVTGATDAFSSLANEAIATGRTQDEMIPLATVLHNTLGVTGDATEALGRMRAQAEALGTVGGPAALEDQLVAAGGVFSTLAKNAANDTAKLTGLLAVLGKGYSPEQAQRVQTGLIGKIQSNPLGFARMLGVPVESLYDEKGELKDLPGLIGRVHDKAIKQFGKKDTFRRALIEFGSPEIAAAITNYNPAEAAKAALIEPSKRAADIAQGRRDSLVGRQLAAQQEIERNRRKTGEKLNPYVTDIQEIVASHPIAGAVGVSLAGNALAGGIEKLGSAVAGTATKFEALNGGMGSLLGKLGQAGLIAGAGALGYEVGTFIDEKLGISDFLSGTGKYSSIKEEEDKKDAAIKAQRSAANPLNPSGADSGFQIVNVHLHNGTDTPMHATADQKHRVSVRQ